VVILGVAFVNFWRTSGDIRARHRGTMEQQRTKIVMDLGDFNPGFLMILLGVLLAVCGWVMAHLADCGRLVC
jgi:hypothetical protein